MTEGNQDYPKPSSKIPHRNLDKKGSNILFTDLTQALKALVYFAKHRLWSIIPPYKKLEGALIAKESKFEGEYFLLIGSEIIEVDCLTYSTLIEGEALRILATRDNKAISIDRLLP